MPAGAQNGILIDTNSRNNVLNGNFVGTTADGDSKLGNALDGVAINGANDNALIGCTIVENPFVYYNVVSGNVAAMNTVRGPTRRGRDISSPDGSTMIAASASNSWNSSL